MEDNRNQQSSEQPQGQNVQTSNTASSQQTADSGNPAERLQDGTNDFQNGDQDPSSANSSKEEGQ